jgi:hypothetical protein
METTKWHADPVTVRDLLDEPDDRAVTIDAYFMHPKLVFNLLPSGATEAVMARLTPGNDPLAIRARQSQLEQTVADIVAAGAVPSLTVLEVSGRPAARGQVVWLEQFLTYSDLASASKQIKAGTEARAHFHGTLQTDDRVRVVGDFNPEHVPFSTGRGRLSGRKDFFMIAYVEDRDPEQITLRPLVIGERVVRPPVPFPDYLPVDPLLVWASDVDEFRDVDFNSLRPSDMKIMATVKEDTVKHAFAEILNEVVVPKDWGGEQLDLWVSSGLRVHGLRMRAAIAFKGPGAGFSVMTPRHLGKNADQMYRLAGTPADLFVVQHCHGIGPSVNGTLRAFAASATPPRRYMLIDGLQTLAILRHFKYL